MADILPIAVFENYKIRRIYDEKTETWYFSVVDIVAAVDPAAGLSGRPELLESP